MALARYALAKVAYFRDDHDGFLAEAEKAALLSPGSATMLADLARLYAFGLGQVTRGATLARQAVALNPRHQGWYRWPIVFELLLADRPAESMAELELIDQPRVWRMVWECLLHSILGNVEATATAKDRLMQAYPHYTCTWAQGVMHYHPTLSERVRALHLQAGLPMG